MLSCSDNPTRQPSEHPSPWTTTWTHPTTQAIYTLTLTQALNTSQADLEACFSLIEETSRPDYAASSMGWNPKAKHKEMRDRDLRYIIVRDPSNHVRAFTSIMPTLEEGEPVVYCYEIHLKPELRGTGLAGVLMGCLETVARNVEVMEKVMLTVFTSNMRASTFYRRLGFEEDESSPRPRKLRGVVKDPDYAIMSKKIERHKAFVGAAGENDVSGEEDWEDVPDRPAKVAKLDSSAASLGGAAPEQ